MVIRFYRLAMDWLGSGGKPVERELAQRRADKCLACPLNDPLKWWETFTAPVVTKLRRTIELKNQIKLSVVHEDKLHVCRSCKCLLPLKVHVPLQLIRETTDLEKLKADCAKEKTTCWILEE